MPNIYENGQCCGKGIKRHLDLFVFQMNIEAESITFQDYFNSPETLESFIYESYKAEIA